MSYDFEFIANLWGKYNLFKTELNTPAFIDVLQELLSFEEITEQEYDAEIALLNMKIGA